MSVNKFPGSAPKVSIIVPVYNTEKYLVKCLDSIIGQTLKEIEIIVLNDGSPDGSAKIAKEYAAADCRIIYLEHENIGLGMTRNRGIEEASGEYLAFVDSDDYIEPQMMELMYQKAMYENLDVVVCQTFINGNGTQTIRKKLPVNKPVDLKVFCKSEFFSKYLLTNLYRYCAWDKIYRSSFIKGNGIIFGDNKKMYAEDLYFQFHIIMSNPVVNFISQTFYHYLQREDSITGSIRNDYMKRHLNLVNYFYDVSKNEEPYVSKVTDAIFFRGLLNEANYSVVYKLGFFSFRKSCMEFYENPAYAKFMASSRKNKSHGILPNKKRRILFKLFIFLNRFKMKRIAECVLYYKFVISASGGQNNGQ